MFNFVCVGTGLSCVDTTELGLVIYSGLASFGLVPFTVLYDLCSEYRISLNRELHAAVKIYVWIRVFLTFPPSLRAAVPEMLNGCELCNYAPYLQIHTPILIYCVRKCY